jgi:hypothetical protein
MSRAESGFVQNGDFPHVARPGPSPEEPDQQLEKTAVGAKITGFGVSRGKSVVTTS